LDRFGKIYLGEIEWSNGTAPRADKGPNNAGLSSNANGETVFRNFFTGCQPASNVFIRPPFFTFHINHHPVGFSGNNSEDAGSTPDAAGESLF
jgi:hypothetical protein